MVVGLVAIENRIAISGKPDGLWTEWDEDGKVMRQTRYKDGEEVEE